MVIKSVRRVIKRGAIILAVVAITLLVIRIYDTQRGPALAPWHTYVPDELSAEQLDKADWTAYLQAEDTLFQQINQHVTQELDEDEQRPINRYFSGSPVYPGKFQHDWNRSYELMPDGAPKGAVVLLHGLTDSPYSLRHVAERYRQRGFVAVGIRLPAHGTVPGALTDVHWQDWLAATRLAVREAERHITPASGRSLPLHIVGFSNGGALALKYALDSLDDATLTHPDQLILISPMIGITSYARFAGLAGLPAIFPAFAKSAWLGILPEFNPFKYNSFPVNGARQSWLLTHELQRQLTRKAQSQTLAALPPVLTFQSVMDFTVSTRAVISAFYNLLPANGSQLVLFDVNRTINFGPLLRDSANGAVNQWLPPAPRYYDTTVITNAAPDSAHAVAFDVNAGMKQESIRDLGIDYPPDVYSLSHVALPFPDSDSLYGRFSLNPREFGLPLGMIAARGERSVLVVDLDTLLRLSSNPFFPYLIQRIDEKIPR
ncbi:alpha/beta hydrolase [Brenneria roseae]|uniref:alpha/beta hydrolase n=1 Tax=Brenneria roseae TaxID=1509241 RepID=UPI0014753E3C|nr:alpha/beta hydrolase [Brenneria roseae]